MSKFKKRVCAVTPEQEASRHGIYSLIRKDGRPKGIHLSLNKGFYQVQLQLKIHAKSRFYISFYTKDHCDIPNLYEELVRVGRKEGLFTRFECMQLMDAYTAWWDYYMN